MSTNSPHHETDANIGREKTRCAFDAGRLLLQRPERYLWIVVHQHRGHYKIFPELARNDKKIADKNTTDWFRIYEIIDTKSKPLNRILEELQDALQQLENDIIDSKLTAFGKEWEPEGYKPEHEG